MKVTQTEIFKDSLIRRATPNPDFEDCFTTTFTSNKTIDLDTLVYKSFSTLANGWVDLLFRLRNVLVKPFKLKTSPDNRPVMKIRPKIEKGGNVAFFDVKEVNNEEVLMYAEDSHLNAYFSISLVQEVTCTTLSCSTSVNFHNIFGRVYFVFVKPFHKLIIKSMLRRIAKDLINKEKLFNKNSVIPDVSY